MLGSALEPNVRGLESALEFCDKEDVVPMVIVAVRLSRQGVKMVLLDASPVDAEEDVRQGFIRSLLMSAGSKINT
jgi:hypothetical protein